MSVPQDSPAGPAFAELARIDLATSDLVQVLQRVAELAAETVPGHAEVSVTLIDLRGGRTPVSTGQLARELDEAQYAEGRGPCLDAVQAGTTTRVDDMADEVDRWPLFVANARKHGVRSSMSVPLPMQSDVAGGLNLYSTSPETFDDATVAVVETFAGYAGVAVANAHLYASSTATADQMRQAMATRAVIEQAKGYVAAQRGISVDEAFDVLVRASSVTNRKLRDIAADVISGAGTVTRGR
ncbi:GAF domain-containing protein [Motilibacter peucedani]|uniref:GAF domain-containing protein n=1 Tax=Motilibacter peucedani TaxID=598650 RepID=A0A420XQD2_9ACTN|nr:GAF and ANTAR domain-containing protein [Motilibacter peucedani]RKS75493.1 GAF domain-containing protein [Motilibacter peucedani]